MEHDSRLVHFLLVATQLVTEIPIQDADGVVGRLVDVEVQRLADLYKPVDNERANLHILVADFQVRLLVLLLRLALRVDGSQDVGGVQLVQLGSPLASAQHVRAALGVVGAAIIAVHQVRVTDKFSTLLSGVAAAEASPLLHVNDGLLVRQVTATER